MKNYLLFAILSCTILAACNKSSGPPPPSILDFIPQKGAASISVIITGLHFDTVISHLTVKFNGITAPIYYAARDTLGVYVPPGATTGKISVTSNGNSATSANDFIILPGTWIQKASMPWPESPNGRNYDIGFAIGPFGYIGLGGDNGGDFRDLYQYDPIADTWTQKASPGIALVAPVCMVINDKAYVGLGYNTDSAALTSRFFEYDPAADTWTRKADFPGVGRQWAFGVAVGGKGYVGLGSGINRTLTDVWQYDPSNDSWTRRPGFPPNGDYPEYPSAFVLGDSVAYIAGSALSTTEAKTFWEYKPSADTWIQKKNIPGGPMLSPSTMVINGIAYVVGGGSENWRYDPVSDSWTQLAFFTDREAGATFVINGIGYYGTGTGYPGYMHTDLWQYKP